MKETVWITAHWNSYAKTFSYNIRGYKSGGDNGEVLIEEREIEFNSVDDKILRLRVSNALREKKQKIIADAHVEAAEVEQTIQEMLALEDHSNE